MDVWKLLEQYGPSVVLFGYLLWCNREDRARITKLEDEQRDVILPLVKSTTEALTKNTEVLQRVEHRLV